jgi:phage terminase small subunit
MPPTDSPDVRMAVLETQLKGLQETQEMIRRELAQGFAASEARHSITAELARNVTVLQERTQNQERALDRAFRLIEQRHREMVEKLDDMSKEVSDTLSEQQKKIDDASRYTQVWRGVAIVLALLVPIVGASVLQTQSTITKALTALQQRVDKLEVPQEHVEPLQR